MSRRRANNEGTIHRLPSGNWRAQVSMDGRRLSYTGKTQRECQEWVRKIRMQMDRGLSYATSQTRLADWLDVWLDAKKTTVAYNTQALYTRYANTHIKPRLGDVKLSEITPARIQAFYRQMQAEGVTPRPIQITHAVLHGSLALALSQGLVAINAASSVIIPQAKQNEMEIWSESEVSSFLVFMRGKKQEYLFTLALATGMRKGELLGLRWSDIDWQAHTLRVQHQVIFMGRTWEFSPPKTAYGRRTIHVGDGIIEKLRAQFEIVNLLRNVAGERWQDYDLVFPSRVGTPQFGNTVITYFRTMVTRSGLPRIRFHDMRHTAASLMLAHGIPVITVSRYLGHSLPSITLNLYGHLVPGQMEAAAEVMDDITSPIEVDI